MALGSRPGLVLPTTSLTWGSIMLPGSFFFEIASFILSMPASASIRSCSPACVVVVIQSSLVIVIATPRRASGGLGNEPLPYVEFNGFTGGFYCYYEGA